ncbi:MAG: hypothetical protein M0038_18915, partial [Pseudomonadota bacterium]|nr:hypothetical protein [Pseudomonadota bacterium]
MSDSLRHRVATAAVLIALLLAVLFALPARATLGVLTLIVLLGAWEWSAFLKSGQRGVRIGYVLLIGAALPLAWHAALTRAGLEWLLGAAALWWAVALGWIVIARGRAAGGSAALAGLCALVPAGLAL